jgi:hypothetical protein
MGSNMATRIMIIATTIKTSIKVIAALEPVFRGECAFIAKRAYAV